MISYPQIDPIIVSLGPLAIRWYGLMYVIGFSAAYLLVAYQAGRFQWQQLRNQLDNLNLTLIVGVILGGRLGYVLFYNLDYYLAHPAEIMAVWEGGMSFHGGCLGALGAGVLFCSLQRLDFWKGADLYVATVPVGLFFGRLGNFINGELFGRPSDLPWAMVFPGGGPLPRHPSQLYEALLEGVVLFVILWSCKDKPWKTRPAPGWPHGSILALFLILYGGFRFLVEYLREPDPQLGLMLNSFSMGQVLSGAMFGLGGILWLWRARSGG
ncbi:prolipoprotein diacylglyceryl transferase [Desulfogranum mediterraneum]|uniref:prolipoprotein diacylglyceryl transferase n=1 Tax=Desulfogranum mediterraneum TaxID=160661 RepID=UPI0003F9D837|nr:prolipoprotein diacylglyceryl transferase [Desulfogranum mediterraneum]